MARRVAFSSSQLEFEKIAEHYTDLEKSLNLYYSEWNPNFSERFSFYTSEEIWAEREHRIEETDSTLAMTILSTIEASFRVDYLQRCYRKKKDQLSRSFRDLYRVKNRSVSLEDDILEMWKNHSSVSAYLVGEIRGAFKYRHWLAHGRYWVPKLGRRYDFTSIYNLAYTVDQKFPFERP